MYAEKINTSLYSFFSTIYVTSLFDVDKENVQVKLDLTGSNFNFNLVRSDLKDIRFSEVSNGDNALYHWVAEVFYSRQIATIWFNIPLLRAGEAKPIFVFFGNPYDNRLSSANTLNFNFVYVFNASPLDSLIWGGCINNSYSDTYGYRTYDRHYSSNAFFTIIPVLLNLKSYEVHTGFYFIDQRSNNTTLSFSGGENTVSFSFYHDKTNVNIETAATVKSYTQQNQYIEFESYNEIGVFYDETIDFFSWSISKRNTVDDVYITEERRVEGNTTAKFIGISSGDNYFYIRWVVITDLISNYIQTDLTDLYKYNYTIYDNILFDSSRYSQDLCSIDYYHYSSCGGNPYKMSDNMSTTLSDFWMSNYDINEGYLIIDLVRKSANLVSRTYPHFDSGHVVYYNASKLSDSGTDKFERHYWQGVALSGWACIDFGSTGQKISCIGLKAIETNLNGMVKGFIIQGGYKDPRFSSSIWIELYNDTCQKVTGWQQFYFDNSNYYRYYKLIVINTYGANICVEEWAMHEADLDNIDGYVITQLRLLPATLDSNENYFPKTISFFGSNNLVNWDTIIGETTTYRPYNNGVYGYWQRYMLQNIKKYRAYKLVMENNWGSSNDRFMLAEWELVRSYKEEITSRILCNVPKVYTIIDSTWSLYFDGVNDYIAANTSLSLYDTCINNFTIELLVKPSATHEIDVESISGTSGVGGQKYIFPPIQGGSIWGSSDHTGLGISIGTNGISVYEHTNSHMPPLLVYQGAILDWTHVAVVCEDKQPKLYLNGILVRTGLTSSKMYVHAALTSSYYIGGMNYGYFAGYIRKVAIWNRALLVSEIQANMRDVFYTSIVGLISYYIMSVGLLGTTMDFISRVNATITGPTWATQSYTMATAGVVYEASPSVSNVWASKKTTFDYGWTYVAIEDVVMKLYDYNLSECTATNINGYRFRKKITIDHTKISTPLVHFPLLINMNFTVGASLQYTLDIFSEIGDNYKKIAVFCGSEQLYVEVSDWSAFLKQGFLWVSKSEWTISTTQDTILYLYYGFQAPDNDVYVGGCGNRPEVWASSYVGAWHDVAVGTRVIDSSIYAHDGIKKATLDPTDAFSSWGAALAYDGINDYVTISGTPNVATSINTGSVFAWIKTSNAGSGYRGIVVKVGAYGMFLNSNIFSIYSWGQSLGRSTGVNLADNNWHYVGFTFDGIDANSPVNNAIIYIDGVPVLTTSLKLSSHNAAIAFGAGAASSTQLFNGIIDEVRISNIVLSASQIYTDYLAHIGALLSYENSNVINDLITLD